MIAIPKSWFVKMWFALFCSLGIRSSNPAMSRLAISRRNTPDLQTGSRNRASSSLQIVAGSKKAFAP